MLSDFPGPALLALLLVASYLIGSVPFGLIAGRLLGGVDLREYGSGSTGATNVSRLLGQGPSLGVFVADVLKGVAVVFLARWLWGSPTEEALAALACIAGHNWPVYVGFRGGRGVASSLGALLVMIPWLAVFSLAVFAVVTWRSRYVSLGSILGAASMPLVAIPLVLLGLAPLAYLVFGAAATGLIAFRHRDNIARLRAGTERRIGERVALD